MKSTLLLRRLLEEVPPRLENLREATVARKPTPVKWSAKEQLGHLLDSAANNHQRMVRTQLEDNPAMPGYDGDRWVELHRYQDTDWRELIERWRTLNGQLLAAVESCSEAAWQRTCTVGRSGPLTLKFVFEDYVDHMLHHLQHIGIEVGDFRKSLTEN
jgi:hypothetical protein